MSKANVKNMTTGHPLPLIFEFMVPLLLGNLFQQTYNVVDAMIVGRSLGSKALAAVGASSSVQFLVLGLCIGTCAGFGIPIAQEFGAGRYDRMRQYEYLSYIETAVMAVFMTVLTAVLCSGILHLMNTPEDIFSDAYIYLLIIFLGIPFTLLYNLLAGILRAVGNSRMPFIFLAAATVINIFMDLLLIRVFKLGCAGAAIATVMSQALSGICCLIYIKKYVSILHIGKEDRRFEAKAAIGLLNIALPMGFQYSITAVGSMVMQSWNNSLGSIYVSAFTAGTKIKQFAICPFDSMGTAAATFVGQNYGAGKIDRVKSGIKQSLAVMIGYGVFAGIMLILFGRDISSIFLKDGEPQVLTAAALYLGRMGTMFWILAVIIGVRSAVQAMGYSGRTVFSGMLEMIARITVSSVFVPIYGYAAITWTDQMAWVFAAIYLTIIGIDVVKKAEKAQKPIS